MTTRSYKRCAQCGNQYIWQGSGPMHHEDVPLNHDTWCRGCMKVIRDALAKVPRKFESRWRPTKEIPGYETLTLDEVLFWEKTPDPFTAPIPEGHIAMPKATRVFVGLVKPQTGEFQNIRMVKSHTQSKHHGRSFRVSTWPSDPTDFAIELNMEYDLVNKEFTGGFWPN